ncbi:MAG TPA: class I SAM-dependent RNA methyltransferase, partial [Desulfurivibrionaceae bacterium]|nr:class I SAM-dependent RNA methyltransferase [Desulfurivibrionaceae bacterium]
MVPGVLPGEEVVVRVLRARKGYLEAELLEIVSGHPDRVAPACPHFGRCGGCDLQHAAYPLQVEIKNGILLEQLRRSGVIGRDEQVGLDAPMAAPLPFGYRQRLRLQVDESGRWGFFRVRSHLLEAITECPLGGVEINAVIRDFPASPALGRLLKQALELEVIASPGDGKVVLLARLRRKARPADLQAATRVVAELATVDAIFLETDGQLRLGPFPSVATEGSGEDPGLVRLAFPPLPELGIPAYTLRQEAGGFCQVNPAQNLRMIERMLVWLEGWEVKRAVDLFCGMGNFSIPLALSGIMVTGSDLQRSAIRSAGRNAATAGLQNCTFVQAAAEQAARDLAAAGERFDLVILDPPRRGCAEVIPLLPGLGAALLLYISCDPATLARDLIGLIGQGYRIEKIGMVDMFPQTAHLESMVLLSK